MEKINLNILLALYYKRLLIHLLGPLEMKMEQFFTPFRRKRWIHGNWAMRNI